MTTKDYTTFGSRLRWAIRSSDMNQKELSERLCCSASMVSDMISNMRTPSLDMLRRILRELDVDARWLIVGDTK